jgi:FixJ family two-component response regulator
VHRVRNQSVYVVDDDDGVRESMTALFRSDGIQAQGFASGRDFLDHIETLAGCVVLDLHMPEMSGLQTFELLRAGGNTVPVIFLSGGLTLAVRALVANVGAIAVLRKPASNEVLVGLVRRVLSQNVSM